MCDVLSTTSSTPMVLSRAFAQLTIEFLWEPLRFADTYKCNLVGALTVDLMAFAFCGQLEMDHYDWMYG